MRVLAAILTHLDAHLVREQLSYLRELSPGSRFVACYGGAPEESARLDGEAVLLINDPALRGAHFDRSLNDTLRTVYTHCVENDSTIEWVLFIEYDHLILQADWETPLLGLAETSNGGLLAKNASPRNDSNWPHYLRIRGNRELDDFIARISVRDDPGVRWGCLGTGMLLRREALAAFCSLEELPGFYVEMFVPTVIYHLGFDVVDVDSLGDLYAGIRWQPELSLDEVRELKCLGRVFAHPFKNISALHEL
jgi:hypothetical protein